jgi:hypothetical protein
VQCEVLPLEKPMANLRNAGTFSEAERTDSHRNEPMANFLELGGIASVSATLLSDRNKMPEYQVAIIAGAWCFS